MYNPTKERQEQTSVTQNSVACLSSATPKSDRPHQTTNPTAKRLSDKHFTHCCGSDINQKQRGLNPDWIAANCYSVDTKQASELLGYPARSGGLVLIGSNGQYQFKPDKPWSDKQGKKAPKNGSVAIFFRDRKVRTFLSLKKIATEPFFIGSHSSR